MSGTAGLESIILRAKLQRPRPPRNLVVRPRLHALLDAGLSGPLTVVVAPAGFGKTTLVSSWIEELAASRRPQIDPIPSAWLSLDEEESDPGNFLRYFVAALRTIFPEAAPETSQLIKARQDPPLEYLSASLSNEIERLPAPFIIVLDDVHLIRGRGVFDLLESWLRHWPRPMHLVLASRFNPSLSLTNWRARGRLIELRSRDLRFTEEETAAFLELALGTEIEAAAIAAIHHRMEGWIAGIWLAIASKGGDVVPTSLPAYTYSGDGYLTTYLLEEGFLNLPGEIQHFLLNISVVRQFCESLCVTLLHDIVPANRVREHLEYLVTNQLFLTMMDDQGEWYRLHHLFRDLLLGRLKRDAGDDAVSRLHRRSARWYAANGLLDEALFHAREAADTALLREIMQQGFRDVLNDEDRPTLERWLAMLPQETIDQDPQLALMRAWDHGFRWELNKIERAVNQAEALLDAARMNGSELLGSDLLRGQIAALRGQVAYNTNQPELAVAHCLKSLALMPPLWPYARGIAAVYLGMGLQSSGRAVEAEELLTSRFEALPDKSDSYALRLLLGLTHVAIQSGNLGGAQRTANAMLRQADESGLTVMQGWAHYLLGYVHYQRAELEAAEAHFATAAAKRFTTQVVAAHSAIAGLAFTYQAQGREEEALAQVDELGQLDLHLYGREQSSTAAARAWLYYRRGDLDRAASWSEGVILPPPDYPLLPWSEGALLVRVGVLIARSDSRDIQQALETLDALDAIAEHTFNGRVPVVLLAWRAMAELARGDILAARRALVRSVKLARRTGHKQIYADLGEPMRQLLRQIAGEHSIAASVSHIRGMADPTPDDSVGERLSKRELQILALMAEPVSFNQISEHLEIAPSTTKRHSVNLYQKLGVHSRWDAVTKAIELGILSGR